MFLLRDIVLYIQIKIHVVSAPVGSSRRSKYLPTTMNPRVIVRPGPLVRTTFGPKTADILAMIHDGRLTFDSETPDGKKIYKLDRVRLGMEQPTAAPVTHVPVVITKEEEPVAPKAAKKPKPTTLEKTLKKLAGMNRGKYEKPK